MISIIKLHNRTKEEFYSRECTGHIFFSQSINLSAYYDSPFTQIIKCIIDKPYHQTNTCIDKLDVIGSILLLFYPIFNLIYCPYCPQI